MKIFKRIVLVTFTLVLWVFLIGYGFDSGKLLLALTSEHEPVMFKEAVKQAAEEDFSGNLAMILFEDGTTNQELYLADGTSIDSHTLFPVASISKWVTAEGILNLVEEGVLNLDVPVDQYLTRWHLPPSEFDNSQVTLRKLLSHSSGFTDDLGYSGFTSEQEVQSLEASLTQASDGPYSDGRAAVGYEPGSRYMYSGAAYTLMQLIIEEVSDTTFSAYMEEAVFTPMGMEESTFERAEDLPNFAPILQEDGTVRSQNWFTAHAAASLTTSASDLSKFAVAHFGTHPFLNASTLEEMSMPHTFVGSTPYYGLGAKLFSQGKEGSNIIGHDGSGNDAINAALRIDLVSKSGILVLETGDYQFASFMADEWLFWKAGIADYVVMTRNTPFVLTLLFVGFAGIGFGYYRRWKP